MKTRIGTDRAVKAAAVLALLCSALAVLVHGAPIPSDAMKAHSMLSARAQPLHAQDINRRGLVNLGNELSDASRGHVALPPEQSFHPDEPDPASIQPSLEALEHGKASKNQGTAKRTRAWPFWDDSKEAEWGKYVDDAGVSRAHLKLDDYDVSSRARMKVYANKANANNPDKAEARLRRPPGSTGFSQQDRDAIKDGSLKKISLAKIRGQDRLRKLRMDEPPDRASNAWVKWKQKMDEEEAVLATFANVARKRQKVDSTGEPIPRHPPSTVGLTPTELKMFRSETSRDYEDLWQILSYRVKQAGLRARKGQGTALGPKKLYADLAWKQGAILRRGFSAEEIEEQIPKALAEANNLAPLKAIEQIPKLLTKMVHEAKLKRDAAAMSRDQLDNSPRVKRPWIDLNRMPENVQLTSSSLAVAADHPQQDMRIGEPSSARLPTRDFAHHAPPGSTLEHP